MDPCELRQARGDGAVRELVASRRPLFEFAVTATLHGYDLDTAEGRVAATAAAIPMVARIKEPELRNEYALQLAGWLGADHQAIGVRVRNQAAAQAKAASIADRRAQRGAAAGAAAAADSIVGRPVRPDPRDRNTFAEREALKLVLQQPGLLAGGYGQLDGLAFTDPAYRAVHDAVNAAGGPADAAVSARTPGSRRSSSGCRPAGFARSSRNSPSSHCGRRRT